jgi:ubiquinone/menaquinone biosynthesis C-methylase UbiE
MQMEGPLAHWYARTTRARPDHVSTARAIADKLPDGGAVLEVAPGPGYMAVELARLGGYRVTGLDISKTLVKIARDNATRAGVDVDFQSGDVAHMPFAADSFDFVVCQAAFKNFPDPVTALNEIHRVLKPGGRVSILDMRKDAPPEAIDREVRSLRLGPMASLITKLIFRFALLRAAYTRPALESVVARSRFGHGKITADGIGFELNLAKDDTTS